MIHRRQFLQTIGCSAVAGALLPGWLQAMAGPAGETLGNPASAGLGFPLGGIGSGSVSIGADGLFTRWNLFGNTPQGSGGALPPPVIQGTPVEEGGFFFLIRLQEAGKPPQLRLLATRNPFATLPPEAKGATSKATQPGIMDTITTRRAYPYFHMTFGAKDLPVKISLEAYTPFVPHDAAASSLPGVYFHFTLQSVSSKPVTATLVAVLLNMTGYDVAARKPYMQVHEREDFRFLSMAASGVPSAQASWGGLSLAALGGKGSYYGGWQHPATFFTELLAQDSLPNKNLASPEAIKAADAANQAAGSTLQYGSVASTHVLPPGGTATTTVLLAWCFPNLYLRTESAAKNEGRLYHQLFGNAREAAIYMLLRQKELKVKMDNFLEVYYQSDLPKEVLQALLTPLGTLVGYSMLTKEGALYLATDHAANGYNLPAMMLHTSQALMQLWPQVQLKTADAQKVEWDAITGTAGAAARRAGMLSIEAACAYLLPLLRQYSLTNDFETLKRHWATMLQVADYIAQYYPVPAIGRPFPATYQSYQLNGASGYLHILCLMVYDGMIQCGGVLNDWNVQKKYRKNREEIAQQLQELLWNKSYYRLWNTLPGAPQRKGLDEGSSAHQLTGLLAAVQAQTKDLLPPDQSLTALKAILANNAAPDGTLKALAWPAPSKPVVLPATGHPSESIGATQGVGLALAPLLMYFGMPAEALLMIKNTATAWQKQTMSLPMEAATENLQGLAMINAALGIKVFRDKLEFEPTLPAQGNRILFFLLPTGYGHFRLSPGKVSIIVLHGNLRMRELVVRIPTAPYKKLGMRLNGEQLRGDLLRMQSDFAEARWKEMMIFKPGNEFEMILS